MNRATILVVASVTAALLAVSASGVEGDVFSPGPIHQEHLDATCNDCHDEVSTPGGDSYAVHEGFDSPCDTCHEDHIGPKADLTTEVDHSAFTGDCTDCHEKDLENNFRPWEHWVKNCDDCHSTDDWDVGSFDHAATGWTCADCHENDLREEFSFGQHWTTNCDACHGTGDWETLALDHSDYFPLTGDHRISDCTECHRTQDFTDWTCYSDCHHEHTRSSIRMEHSGEGIRNYENCLRCHPDGREHDD